MSFLFNLFPPQQGSQDIIGSLFVRIHTSFVSQGISYQNISTSSTQIKSILQLNSSISQHQNLSALCHFTLKEHLQIKLELHPIDNYDPTQEIPQKTIDFIKILNNTTNGIYFWNKQNPRVIALRYKIPFSALKYLSSYLREIYTEASHQFGRFLVFMKQIPKVDSQLSRKTNGILTNLRHLKEQFQFRRQRRPKHTVCYNLSNSSIKLISESLELINLCFGKLKEYSWQSKIDIRTCHKTYQTTKKAIEQTMKKDQQKVSRFIVKGIEIQNVLEEELIDEGGFSSIKRGVYCFNQKITINDPITLKTASEMNNMEQNDKIQIKKVLIRKIPKIENDSSHLNQYKFLQYLRNQKNPHLADYYLSKSNNKQYNKGIYIRYYQHNLAYTYQLFKQEQLLKISRQILEGILFLSENKILHRDLKELNVLLDEVGNAKLIDFGSACGFFSNSNGEFVAHNNKLMATKGYYFSYNNVEIPFILSRYKREQYQQSQTFDMFAFGQILKNIFSLDLNQDNLIHRELTYLAKRCQEINPQDRIYPTEALCYLQEIINLFTQQNNVFTQQQRSNSLNSSASQ